MIDPLVWKIPVPQNSASSALARVDFADAHATLVRDREPNLPTRFAKAMFGKPPAWMNRVMALRDGAVAPFGLKTSSTLREDAKTRKDAYIGMFKILAADDHELLLGEDDSHLDFRVSILASDQAEGSEITVVTAVKLNNLLGRLYLLPVAQGHRLIVPALMKRAARAMAGEAG